MKAAVVMGSDSDFQIVKETIMVLNQFQIATDCRIISAHRTPDKIVEFTNQIADRGIEVVIAAAGKAAHLPGVIAAGTTVPVIGLPIKSSTLDGLDSLFSIVQMPSGIPVATVGINAARNAGILAVQLLSIGYPQLRSKLIQYRSAMAAEVDKKDRQLQANLADYIKS